MTGHRIVPRTYSRLFEQSTFSFEKMTRTGRRGFPVAEPHKLEHAVLPNFSSSFSPRGGGLFSCPLPPLHKPFFSFFFFPPPPFKKSHTPHAPPSLPTTT